MPRECWVLQRRRPVVEIVFQRTDGQSITLTLLADTGGGDLNLPFHLILSEEDCKHLSGRSAPPVLLNRPFSGGSRKCQAWQLDAFIPSLGVTQRVIAAAVPAKELPFHGIAVFCFLNIFTYGNFGDGTQFGLETR